MGYINIFVSKEQNLYVKNSQLCIAGRTFPVEEINCLMIDNLYTALSTYSINALVSAGATVILCDDIHMPATVMLPYQGYYKRLETLELQQNIPKPRLKQLWQQIVKRKILGQSETLHFQGKEEAAEKLEELAKQVASNDSGNKEAEAARIYFRTLMGKGFSRDSEEPVNGILNYGYAIIRSLIARHLCARGFECAYGVKHHNAFNAFNLADDLIEPYRPIIDCYIMSKTNIHAPLTPEVKRIVFGICELEVMSGTEAHILSNSVSRMIESFLAYYKKDRDDLLFPRLMGTCYHSYE